MSDFYRREFRFFYVTYIIIFINLFIFLLMTLAGGSTNANVLIFFGAKVNPLIDLGQYWRLLTANFIHIGFTHLLFNTYALFVLGKYSESIFGHAKLVFMYLFCGLTGSTLSYLLSPSLSAGASGAIFGLLGAIIVYGWNNRFLRRSGLITNFLIILGINLVFGMVMPGIDNFGHMGGLLGGLFLGGLFRFLER